MLPRLQPPKHQRPTPAPLCESPAVSALADRLESALESAGSATANTADRAEDHGSLAEEFWRTTGARTPLLETGSRGERIVTFLWRATDASSILLFVNRLTDETDLTRSELARLPGTDIWHLSYALEPSWRGSYGFIVHEGAETAPWHGTADQVSLRQMLDRARRDPRNPLTCPNRAGNTLSVAELPAAPPQPWRHLGEAPEAPDTEPTRLREETDPDGRECWLYESPAGGASDLPHDTPLWLILDGEVWTERFGFERTLDAMFREGIIPPLRAVFIHSGGVAMRWASLSQDSGFIDTLADRYLPWAREAFGADTSAERCGVAGQSLGGIVSLRAGALRPDAFGGIFSQSASLWLEAPGLDRLARAAGPRPHFRVEVGTHEWVLLEPNRAFHARLVEADVDAELVEYAGGHDYACWRGGLADGIAALSARMTAGDSAQPTR